MKRLLFLLVHMLALTVWAGAGMPRIRNFTRNDYGGAPQNWSVAQDSLGRIYVGNGYAMLLFDGQRWLNFGLPNSTSVRALMADDTTGRIYAAGTEELGYFLPDSLSGALTYTSLMPLLGDRTPPFTEVWNIFRADGSIWFQSDWHLLEYDGEHMTINRAADRIARSAVIDGRICVALENGRFQIFNGVSFEPLPANLPGRKVTAILPSAGDGSFMVATADHGLYQISAAGAEPMHTDIDAFLRDNQVFCGAHNNGNYVFGTVNRGAVVKNFVTGETRYLSKENGLQNNTVLNAAFDRVGNLWLCLDNGLDYAQITSPIMTLIGPAHDVGAGYTSLRLDNRVLFGTNQGLYSASYPFEASPSPLPLRRELKGQIWSINRDSVSVFIGADTGLYVADGSSFRRVDGLGGTYMAETFPADNEIALASTYDGFHRLSRVAGRWVDRGRIRGYNDIGGRFVYGRGGELWLPHWRKGVYRLRFNPAEGVFSECTLFGADSGLPSVSSISVMVDRGRVVFSTANGFYVFDDSTQRFVADDELNGLFGIMPYGRVVPLSDGTLILATDFGLGIARGNAVDSISLRPFIDKVIPGYMNLNFFAPGELIVSNQDGFWTIDTERLPPAADARPYVSSVYANRDSLVYMVHDDVDCASLRLPFGLSSLRFNFAASEYSSPRAVEFSSMLEPYESRFSPFSAESSREYTRLSEGDYTLRLRLRDAAGNVSETTFSLLITPPWYRSLPARMLYALISVLFIVGVGFVVKRRLNASRRRLEERKDYEIAALKSEQLEHDIRHKSSELSTTTMNLIRKNETLQEIASQIERLTPLPGASVDAAALRRQLEKIHRRIEENIGHDDDVAAFTRNFDIVYENYTKRLMARHPNLTVSDKRMCCYIKMGLSSKEIAPLVNISFKSVEMARYRLRKKMAIPADTTLADYLSAI